jgi:hypothetical protein
MNALDGHVKINITRANLFEDSFQEVMPAAGDTFLRLMIPYTLRVCCLLGCIIYY